MPALVLDAHLGHALAAALRQRGVDAWHVSLWRDGHYRRADDSTLLQAAAADGRILVTHDTSTVPLAAYQFLADGMPFAGVVVLSSRIKRTDIGAHLVAIMAELEGRPAQAWTSAVVYAGRRRYCLAPGRQAHPSPRRLTCPIHVRVSCPGRLPHSRR